MKSISRASHRSWFVRSLDATRENRKTPAQWIRIVKQERGAMPQREPVNPSNAREWNAPS